MGKHRVRRAIGGLAAFAVLVAAVPVAAALIGSAGRESDVASVAPHDVAIVFGAGVDPSGRPSAYLAARLEVAVALYESGKAKVLLLSGSNPEESYNEPEAMRAYLVDRGVPAKHIVLDYAGADTYGTCVRATRIFGVHSAILVSQTYHLARAITTCRLVGVDAVGVGDETMKTAYPNLWGAYVLRELAGYEKMAWDVVTGVQPILGAPESAIAEALAG